MNSFNKHLIFVIDSQRFGLEFDYICSVISAAELTPFKSSEKNIMGLLNLHGELVPVLDMRHILSLPQKELDLSDQFIICSNENRKFALAVDRVIEVCEFKDLPKSTTQNLSYVCSVFNAEEDPIYILHVSSMISSVLPESNYA